MEFQLLHRVAASVFVIASSNLIAALHECMYGVAIHELRDMRSQIGGAVIYFITGVITVAPMLAIPMKALGKAEW